MAPPLGARERLLGMFERGERALGMIVGSTDPAITDILGAAGFDFLVFDNEHGPLGPESALHHVRAAEAAGTIPMVRILENSQTLIQKFLDIGCQGIVVPHVDTAEDARRAVDALRFAPGGTRGMCPANHAAAYSTAGFVDYSRRSEANAMAIPIIESRRSVENIEAIVATDGIDLVFFGPGDLSQDMGVAHLGWESEELVAAWRRVRDVAQSAGKHVMSICYPQVSVERADQLFREGAAAVCYYIDLLLFRELAEQVAGVRKGGLSAR